MDVGANDVSVGAISPRSVTGKRLSHEEVQRERAYVDWLLTLTPPARDDLPPPDDSWAAFMVVRRKQMETARLQQVSQRRREERWRKRGLSPPAKQVNHRAQVQREWKAYCKEHGTSIEIGHLRDKFVERRRQSRNSERRRAKRLAAEPSGRKLGRPIDPDAKRRREESDAQIQLHLIKVRRKEQEQKDSLEASLAVDLMQRRDATIKKSLQEQKELRPNDSPHAVAYGFWRSKMLWEASTRCATDTSLRDYVRAKILAGNAKARMCKARACESGWMAATESASTAVERAEAEAALKHAAEHVKLMEAVAVAMVGAAFIALRRRRIQDPPALAALLAPDRPWVLAAFKSAKVAPIAVNLQDFDTLPGPMPPVPSGQEKLPDGLT